MCVSVSVSVCVCVLYICTSSRVVAEMKLYNLFWCPSVHSSCLVIPSNAYDREFEVIVHRVVVQRIVKIRTKFAMNNIAVEITNCTLYGLLL